MVFPLFTFTNEHFSAKLKTGESSTKQNSVCRRPLTNRGFYTVLVHQMWVPVISLKKSFSLDVHLKTNPKNPFATWALRCIQTLQVSAHTPLGNITPTMKLNNPLNVARGGVGNWGSFSNMACIRNPEQGRLPLRTPEQCPAVGEGDLSSAEILNMKIRSTELGASFAAPAKCWPYEAAFVRRMGVMGRMTFSMLLSFKHCCYSTA